jgi:hypothetical protein
VPGIRGQLSMTVAGKLSGGYLVIVRSQTATTTQTGDLWVDGQLVSAGVSFTSGAMIPVQHLSTGEEMNGVPPPPTATDPGAVEHIVYFLSPMGAICCVARWGPIR